MAAKLDSVTNPLPDVSAGPVLFLLDASHSVEQELLESWVKDTRKSSAQQEHSVDAVVLPILFGVKGRLKLGELPDKLEGAGETRVVPARVVWLPRESARRNTPRLRDLFLGDSRHPGKLAARAILKMDPGRAHCIVGASATLHELRDRFESLAVPTDAAGARDKFAAFVLRQAGLALDVAERRLKGNRYKVPRYVAESLRASPQFSEALEKLAAELGRPVAALREEADRYMKEMIAQPNPFFIDWMGAVTRRIVSLGYEKDIVTDPDDVERTRAIMRDNPTALLWSHKSHVDGMAVLSILYENDLPAPHSFGGINMAFFGLGTLGRRSGVIYIRRTFADNPVYKLVFRHYLGYLMEKRFPFSWAFEGTRSRVGKLMPPRYGMIKYVLEAAHATGTTDLHFIPVSISYDLIGEAAEYALEEAGASKRPESFGWFLGYIRKLRAPKGRVYLDFCKPVVVKGAVPHVNDVDVPKIAFEVAVRVNDVTPVTFASLACMALLGAAPRALTFEEFRDEVRSLVDWLRVRNVRMADYFEKRRDRQVVRLARITIARGLVMRYDEGPETVYGIPEDGYATAGYYRNTIVHYFVNKAILELALAGATNLDDAGGMDAFWQETERLRDIFKFEFFYAAKAEFRRQLEEELARYAPDWEARIAPGGESAAAFLAEMRPLVAHATLLPYVEAYGVVADIVQGLEPDEGIDEKDCVSRSLKLGQQRRLQGRISNSASISKVLFANGYRQLSHMGLTGAGNPANGELRRVAAADSAELARRMTRIRSLATVAA